MSETATPSAQATTQAADAAANPSETKEASTQATTAAAAPAEKAQGEAPVKPAETEKKESEAKDKKTEPSKEPEKKPEGAPEKYELKLPEGSPLDAGAVERIATFAKEQGLSNKHAQAVLERESQAVAAFAKGQQDELNQKADKLWPEASQNDKEIGGASFNQNVELAHRVAQKFGSEAFNEMMMKSGLGNHPEVIRTFMRIGKQMSEDQLIVPGAQTGGKKSIEEIFYPNMKK